MRSLRRSVSSGVAGASAGSTPAGGTAPGVGGQLGEEVLQRHRLEAQRIVSRLEAVQVEGVVDELQQLDARALDRR